MIGVVTATTDYARAARAIESWTAYAEQPLVVHIVSNGSGGHYLGTVPAFRAGIDELLATRPEIDILACFHDDLTILEPGWDQRVQRFFDEIAACGLLGFGGALALGARELYKAPYAPMQLARAYFRSNLDDAETHGLRSLLPERVACLDGFSQIGRRAFWEGRGPAMTDSSFGRPWTVLEQLGVVHHFYDGMLGCLAARYGWQTWYLPIACHHAGGQTAVGDAGYQEWAQTQVEGGDHGFWEAAHQIGYEEFRDVLPLRV